MSASLDPQKQGDITSSFVLFATVFRGAMVSGLLAGAGDNERGKPDPEAFLIATERLCAAKRSLLNLLDTPFGLAGPVPSLRRIECSDGLNRTNEVPKTNNCIIL